MFTYVLADAFSPVAKALAKELSASYSARGSIPAASAVEYHSVRTPAISKARPAPRLRSEQGRLRGFGLGSGIPAGVVRLTHHPLTG